MATLLDWAIVDTTVETAEVATIDEAEAVASDAREVAAADETETGDENEVIAVDEAKVIAVNVNPLTEGVGSDSPMLDRTTVIIKCCMEIVWPPHLG